MTQTLSSEHIFELSGLSCPACASKIEETINKAEKYEAVLNFATRKIVLRVAHGISHSDVLKFLQETVQRIEPGVKILSECCLFEASNTVQETNEEKAIKRASIALYSALMFFILALLVPSAYTAVKFFLFFAAYILSGYGCLKRAVTNIFKGEMFDECFLMSIATIGAFVIGEYAEGAAVMIFYGLGEKLQERTADYSRKSIKSLIELRPAYANLQIDGKLIETTPEKVQIGETIIIKPGEKVPLDSLVTEGFTSLDVSALSGESLPKSVKTGDEILSGSVNTGGLIQAKTLRLWNDSAAAKILEMAENAALNKAKTEKFITRFARYYTPAVVSIALLLAFIPPLILPQASLSTWLYRALVFLVASCPCALLISVPLAFFAGVGLASKRGILARGGNHLETLAETQTVLFDKTGTLTDGSFKITKIFPENGKSEEELLKLAVLAEAGSNHPIALSVLKASKQEKLPKGLSWEEKPGMGIIAKNSDESIIIAAGNTTLMKFCEVSSIPSETQATSVYIAKNGKLAGRIDFSQSIRPEASEAIEKLKKLGVKRIAMLTGDNKAEAQKTAQALGINEVYAELLPGDKVKTIEELKKTAKGKVIFAGDGINDAPALAASDIGFAMGTGTDIAMEAADIVVMSDNLLKLPEAITIGKRTKRTATLNIIITFTVKLIVLALGAAGLTKMWAAVFADVGTTIITALNSALLLKNSN